VSAQYKAWVCGRSLYGTAISNPLSHVNVVCCAGRGLCVLADHSSRGVLENLMRLSVVLKPR